MTMMAQLGKRPPNSPAMRTAMVKPLPGAPIIEVASDNEKERANIELVSKATDAFNAKKIADYMAVWAADGIEHDLGMPKDSKGKKAITSSANYYRTAFPDLQLETPNMFAAGDYVVVLGTATGTNTGKLGTMKPTGKKVTMHYAEVFRIKNAKIAEVWRIYNGMAFAKQLGMLTPKAQQPEQDTMKGTTP
jgi:predicted ester cyclase